MNSILIGIFVICNLIIACIYYKKQKGVFQFPFLVACVSFTFVLPQLLSIAHYYEDGNLMLIPLSFMIICNIALYIGYYLGTRKKNNQQIKLLNSFSISYKIIIFAVVGILAYFLNRGQYKGGAVSGIFVVINFFASYMIYAMILAFILLDESKRKWLWLKILIVLLVLLSIDNLIQNARRAEAITLFLTIVYFVKNKYITYNRIKILIPLFFIIGLLFNTQVGEYRNNAYSEEMSAWDNIKSIDISNAYQELKDDYEGEVYNAMEGINYCYDNSIFDYGAFNWNALVFNFVPKAFVGDAMKNILYIETSYDEIKKELTASGSTMTGYFDSFASFGFVGWIKFLIIGFIMGWLWNRRENSPISLLLYMGLLTPSLHLLTHSSGNFFSSLVFFFVFVYPFIKNSMKRYKKSFTNHES